MPELTPPLQRVLSVVTALLLLVGMIGAFATQNDDNASDIATGPGASTTTTDAAGFGDGGSGGGDGGGTGGPGGSLVTTTTKPGGPTTTAKRGTAATSPPTTVKGCSSSPAGAAAATADPGAPKAPTPGTYVYESTTTGDYASPCSRSNTKIAAGADGAGVVRRQTTSENPGGSLTSHEAWSADAMRQERLVFTGGFGTFECDWNPDPVVLSFPLAVGKTWSADSSCDTSVQGLPLHIRAQGTGKVTGRTSVVVDGTRVNVWVIESTIKVTTTGAGNTTQDQVGTSYFEPTRGIEVYSKDTSTGGQEGHNTVEKRLTSFNPN